MSEDYKESYDYLLSYALWQKKRIDSLERKVKAYELYKKGYEWLRGKFTTPKYIIC